MKYSISRKTLTLGMTLLFLGTIFVPIISSDTGDSGKVIMDVEEPELDRLITGIISESTSKKSASSSNGSQQSSGSGSTSFTYGPLGNRIGSTDAEGNTTFHLYEGVDVIQDRMSDGTLAREYVSGVGGKLAMIDHTDSGNKPAGEDEVLYYLHDILGSIVALINTGGAVVERYYYNPYGETNITDLLGTTERSESAFGNTFMWTGKQCDTENKLYHFPARSYSPTLGRWLQRDPLGYVDSLNLYEYVRSNPLSYVDPLGLQISPTDDVEQLAGKLNDKANEFFDKTLGTNSPLPPSQQIDWATSAIIYDKVSGVVSAIWNIKHHPDKVVMGIASAVDNVGETYKMYRKSGHGAIESVVDVGVDGIRNFIGIDDIYSGIVGEDRYGKQIGGFGNRLRVGGGGMFDLGISTTGVYGVARTAGSRTARGVGGLAKVAKVKIVNTGRRIAERMKTVANRPLPTRFDLYPPKTLVRSLDGTPVFSLTSKARMSQAQRLITDEEILEAFFSNPGWSWGRTPGTKVKLTGKSVIIVALIDAHPGDWAKTVFFHHKGLGNEIQKIQRIKQLQLKYGG